MSDNTYKQGQNDANQGKGAASTNGMTHQEANSYNAGYTNSNQDSNKK